MIMKVGEASRFSSSPDVTWLLGDAAARIALLSTPGPGENEMTIAVVYTPTRALTFFLRIIS